MLRDLSSPSTVRADFRIAFGLLVVQRASGAGNNEQQNVVHREAIEAGGKLFASFVVMCS